MENKITKMAELVRRYDFELLAKKSERLATYAAGNAITGLSSQSLNVASAAANANLRLIGIVPGPDNNWGDTFVNALVQISEHQNTANIAAY